ncbi:NAD-dependent epimerase/dehydratase family protein [Clostridia bacterium OttesenSCG-928-O13]|nr:NAD-dependent epimerase/dehydratase family protein [Clostridia bacterium OttesenSCG-928-O13]
MENANSTFVAPTKEDAILITGAAGFLGKNLVARLRCEGYKNLLLYDINSTQEDLLAYAQKASFVYHLAGVNRPADNAEFYTGNADLTKSLLAAMEEAGSTAPILLSSTAQAGNGSDYGKSKEEAENAVFAYGEKTGKPYFIYRLAGVFGKWSRPNYNTVVATFCHNIARGLPIEVRDPAYSLPLCYVDDVVDNFIARMNPATPLAPRFEREGGFYLGVEPLYEVTLGWLAGTIRSFAHTRKSLGLPDMSDGITKKLWATYLSFLPEEDFSYPLAMNVDARGSFTEFLRTYEHGQVSVNVAKPGVVKGNHWHDTKNEKFLVVAGRGIIRFRAVGGTAVIEYPVSGEEMQVVDIPPGYTHNIENLGDTDLITVMWASEPYNEDSPDTHFEEV